MNILYCDNCKRYIKPFKKFPVLLAILLYIATGGIAFWGYLLFYLFWKKSECPVCGNKNLLSDKVKELIGQEAKAIEPVDKNKELLIKTNESLRNALNSAEHELEIGVVKATHGMKILLRQIFGSILSIFGGLLSIGFVINLVEHPDNFFKWLLAISLMGLPMFLGGIYLLKTTKTIKEKEEYEAIEKKILKIAALKNREVSVADIAQNTELSLKEAESYLDKIELQGYATSYLSAEGTIKYKIYS